MGCATGVSIKTNASGQTPRLLQEPTGEHQQPNRLAFQAPDVKTQHQDQSGKSSNGTDQPDRTFLQAVPLLAVVGMVSTFNLNTTSQL